MQAVENKQTVQKSISTCAYGSIVELKINPDRTELIITHDTCHARISLHGGQILSWQPKGHEEVFWLSKKSKYGLDSAIRGGIPICWPWFGSYEGAQNHGFARTSLWQLAKVDISESNIRLELMLTGSEYSPYWPYAFAVKQVITFSDTFSQKLIIVNTGNKDFQFTDALHSYFRVSHPESVTVPDLSHSIFDDKINQFNGCRPKDVFDCVGPIDRIYHNNSSMTIFDKVAKRAIEIKKSNSAQWVLWNPGIEIATNMADIHQHGEQEFVCLEAANTHWVNVPAGETVELSQEVQVYKL